MSSTVLRTRIAPTPSGYLHIGNVFSFIKTWLIAQQIGAKVFLRIDDLDTDRVKKDYIDDIFQTLEFIGLQPDEGPSGSDDFLKNFSQRSRMDQYVPLVSKLRDQKLLFACDCTRKQIHDRSERGMYTGFCRERAIDFESAGVAWRLNTKALSPIYITDMLTGEVTSPDLKQTMGDFVVQRKDGIPSYQVASLADDVHFKINVIVRGMDLIPSSGAQMAMANALGMDIFQKMKWHHHALLMADVDRKLSKSAGDTSIHWMRKQGYTKQMLLEKAGLFIFGKNIAFSRLEELKEIPLVGLIS